MSNKVCALCGASEILIVGRRGVMCRACLAKAITSVLVTEVSEASKLTADNRCLLCGDIAVQKGAYAAVRMPYVVCAECMERGLEITGGDSFLVARF